MVGDGYRNVVHCESAEWQDYRWLEPDAAPVHCRFTYYTEDTEDE